MNHSLNILTNTILRCFYRLRAEQSSKSMYLTTSKTCRVTFVHTRQLLAYFLKFRYYEKAIKFEKKKLSSELLIKWEVLSNRKP